VTWENVYAARCPARGASTFPSAKSTRCCLLAAGFRCREGGVNGVAGGLAVSRVGVGMAVPADLAGMGVAEAELDVVVGQGGVAQQRGVGVPQPVEGGPGRDARSGPDEGPPDALPPVRGVEHVPRGVVNSSPVGPGG